MAMALGPAESDADEEVMAAINTTPLVDVMLVLLIIFLITIPVVVYTVPLELPKQVNHPFQTGPQNVSLSVTKEGDVFWNDRRLADNAALLEKLKAIAVLVPQPEVKVYGDENVRYEFIGRVVLAFQRAGIAKISFVVEPPPRGE
jgi:biopolymer transport protein ExbD